MKPNTTINQLGNINTSENNFTEYEGRYFVAANELVSPRFQPRVVPKFKGSSEMMVIIDMSAVDAATGERVYITLWPRDNATDADIKALPKFFHDVTFRIGYWEEKDADGKVVRTVISEQPKWTVAENVNEDGVVEPFALQGGKRDYDAEEKARKAAK